MKNSVFWDVTPCRSCVSWSFRGTYPLHLQGRRIRERGTSVSRWQQNLYITQNQKFLITLFCRKGGGRLGKFIVLSGTCFLGFECAVRLGLGDAGDGKGRVCEGRTKPIKSTPRFLFPYSNLLVYNPLYICTHKYINADGCRIYTFHIDW
jgi:hypothetical protein